MHYKQQTQFIIISFILLLSTINAKAQKCKYEKNEVDALTEFAIKRTSPQMLLRVNNEPIYFKAQCIGPNKYIKLSYYNYGNFTFKEEREISFITSTNEEIILYPRIVPVDTTKSSYMDVTSLLIYKLSQEQYATLKDTPIQSFKYFVASGWLEEEISNKKHQVIMNLLNCVE